MNSYCEINKDSNVCMLTMAFRLLNKIWWEAMNLD
jgi:hypothetical protein